VERRKLHQANLEVIPRLVVVPGSDPYGAVDFVDDLTYVKGETDPFTGVLVSRFRSIEKREIHVADGTQYRAIEFYEDGVVHMGDSPPENAQTVETITIQPTKSTAAPAPAPAPERRADPVPSQPVAPPATEVPMAAPVDISAMTLEELDQRCEAARQDKIAPLREAEIESCKQGKRNDPAECESVSADFGDGGRTVSGAMRPRMFDDLPECVEALHEQNTRSR
jgi:hypothetical protein